MKTLSMCVSIANIAKKYIYNSTYNYKSPFVVRKTIYICSYCVRYLSISFTIGTTFHSPDLFWNL